VFGANEAVRLVMDVLDGGGSAAEAAQALVREAVRRAMEGPDGDADNTTAVVRVQNACCSGSARQLSSFLLAVAIRELWSST